MLAPAERFFIMCIKIAKRNSILLDLIKLTSTLATIRTEHLIIAAIATLMLRGMLTEFPRILGTSSLVQSSRGTVAHVLILARRYTNALLVTFAPIETCKRVWIGGIANLIPPGTVDAAPTLVAIDAVLSVDIRFLEPWEIGADYGMVERVVLVACGAFSAVMTFEPAGAGCMVRVGGVCGGEGCDE